MNYKRPKNLLSKGSTNSKTAKNTLDTFILYIAPYNLNDKGQNLCPKASAGCAAACLYSAGRGKFSNVQQSRINKANYYVYDRFNFLAQLSDEIDAINKKAEKQNKKVAIRLNGTSDLPFYEMLNADKRNWKQIIFYDYTKIPKKAIKHLQSPNYHVCFSLNEENRDDAFELLKHGVNIAAVFKGELPTTYKGFEVVDADQHDMTMCFNSGKILGLRAKGDAKKDTTGFVITDY